MKEQFLNKAIVIGADHHNTLGIIRSLGEKGVIVHAILLDCTTSFVSKSKYLRDVAYSSSHASELADLLIQKYKNETPQNNNQLIS